MVSEKPSLPHSKPLVIKALTMSPIPCFNKQRSGCRPFCDILIGETKIFTTAQEYERMRWVDENVDTEADLATSYQLNQLNVLQRTQDPGG